MQGVRPQGYSLASVYRRSALTQRVSVCYQCKHTLTAACCSRGASVSGLLATNSSCLTTSSTRNYRCGNFLLSAICGLQQRVVPLFLCSDLILQDPTRLDRDDVSSVFLLCSALLQSRLRSLDVVRMQQRINVMNQKVETLFP